MAPLSTTASALPSPPSPRSSRSTHLFTFCRFSGLNAILSGPAGGVVGFAGTSYVEDKRPLVGFDMGGTSTDVSRYGGAFEHVLETETAGVTIQAPQLDINVRLLSSPFSLTSLG